MALTETDGMIAANCQKLCVLLQHHLHLTDQRQIAGHKVRIVADVVIMLALLLQQCLVDGVVQISIIGDEQALCNRYATTIDKSK